MTPPLHTPSALRPWLLKAALVASAAAPMLLAGGCMFISPRATGPKSTTTAHAAGAAITVDTRNGSVEVIAETSRSDVQIDATVTCAGGTQQEADQRLAQATLDVARDTSHRLIVKPVFPGGERSGDGASFVIRLPDADGIDITTSNGKVTLTALKGAANIKTSNGSVAITDHQGAATIDTSNGGIRVANLLGDLKAATANGSVTAGGVAGKANVETSNGAIDLRLAADQSGPIVLRSSNGSVTVRVGKAFHGKVTLDTSNGSVRIGGAGVKTLSRSKSDAVIQVGEGGEASTIRSSNGSITFDVE